MKGEGASARAAVMSANGGWSLEPIPCAGAAFRAGSLPPGSIRGGNALRTNSQISLVLRKLNSSEQASPIPSSVNLRLTR